MESQAAHWWHLLLQCEEASESSEVVVPRRLPVRRVLTVPTLVSGLWSLVLAVPTTARRSLSLVSGLILPVKT